MSLWFRNFRDRWVDFAPAKNDPEAQHRARQRPDEMLYSYYPGAFSTHPGQRIAGRGVDTQGNLTDETWYTRDLTPNDGVTAHNQFELRLWQFLRGIIPVGEFAAAMYDAETLWAVTNNAGDLSWGTPGTPVLSLFTHPTRVPDSVATKPVTGEWVFDEAPLQDAEVRWNMPEGASVFGAYVEGGPPDYSNLMGANLLYTQLLDFRDDFRGVPFVERRGALGRNDYNPEIHGVPAPPT